jgi:hypothetical protein
MTNKKASGVIARHFSLKYTAYSDRKRQLELGITKGIWHHSHAGKSPRKSGLSSLY